MRHTYLLWEALSQDDLFHGSVPSLGAALHSPIAYRGHNCEREVVWLTEGTTAKEKFCARTNIHRAQTYTHWGNMKNAEFCFLR